MLLTNADADADAKMSEELLKGSRTFGKNKSPWVSVFNLCNAAIGAGVLSFPYGFRETGVLGGLFFTSLVWVVEVFALCLLVRVAERYNSKSYQLLFPANGASVLGSRKAVVTSVTMMIFLIGTMISYLISTESSRIFPPLPLHCSNWNSDASVEFMIWHLVCSVLGPRMAVFTSLVILSLIIGGNLSYFVITGDVFTGVFIEIFGVDSILANRRVVIVLFAVVVVLPLSLQTTLTALKYSSLISVIMLTYLAVALVSIGLLHIVKNGFPHDLLIWEAGIHVFVIMDIVVFAFQCHVQVVPIFAELVEHPKSFWGTCEELLDEEVDPEALLKGGRSERIKRMDGVIFISMSICLAGYCVVGEFGYILFQDVESDVLNSFGNKNFFMNIARIGMAVVAMICYPVQHHPIRSIVDDAVKHVTSVRSDEFSWTRHILITLGFFSFTLGTSLLVKDLGKVFSIVGSTGGVTVVFIVPGMLLILGSHSDSVAHIDGTSAEDATKLRTRSCKQMCIQSFGGTFMVMFGFIIFIATAYVTMMGLIGK